MRELCCTAEPAFKRKRAAFAVLPAIQRLGHAHAFARYFDLVLVEQEADLGIAQQRRKREERHQHADGRRQHKPQHPHQPVVTAAGCSKQLAAVAHLICAFGHDGGAEPFGGGNAGSVPQYVMRGRRYQFPASLPGRARRARAGNRNTPARSRGGLRASAAHPSLRTAHGESARRSRRSRAVHR